jgi:muramoyltetrapeptide carboxypeptidase LdcA involved in peptidoglycan recycling
MAKTNKEKQCSTKHIEERQTLAMVLSDLLRSACITLFVLVDFGHAIL